MTIKITPSFDYEKEYWLQGIQFVAGIDEAGMGALAGPVVASAVIFDASVEINGLRDSKLLSSKQRDNLVNTIHEQSLAWAIGEASVEEISKLNIRGASHLAMRRAIDALSFQPDILLIDGNPAQPHPIIPAVNIIRGDSLSMSIAAASVLAKVHRDALMTDLDKEFPAYGFAGHKGYGSAHHMAALTKNGASKHHRPTYAPIAKLLNLTNN